MPEHGHDFRGRAAFVSGGASGIGLACARQLAAAGADVIVADLTGADDAAAAIGGRDVTLDVTNAAAMAEAFTGREVTLAVNAAGIGGAPGDVAGDMVNGDDWARVIDVNLTGVRHCMMYQLAAMRRAGRGAIVNIASVMALHGSPGRAAYSAAKHGLIGLTKSAALEEAARGIRVNALCPGFIATPLLTGALSPAQLTEVAARHPLGRLGTADEVAAFALFLLSDAAAFVTGSVHLVDGGYSAR